MFDEIADDPSTNSNHGLNEASATRPLTRRLETIIETWARSQYELVVLAAEFADSPEWVITGSPTAAHWLAIVADVEPCTAREWIRIGRLLKTLPATADAFKTREISYSKVRTLTRLATPDNERELLDIAKTTTAADLGRALAAWLHRNTDPEDLAAHHRRQRSVKWRNEPDGMVTFTLRLPPLLAGLLIAFLTTWIMRTRAPTGPADAWPTVAQQHADALEALVTDGAGSIDTEVVVHVRGRGRLVDERDRNCVDCGRAELLQYDHVPSFEESGHTITGELELRCAPCHHRRHAAAPSAATSAGCP